MTTDTQNKADRWNFDYTSMAPRDLNTCLYFVYHGRMPKGDELEDEQIDLESWGTGTELPLVELAALYAHGVLWYEEDGQRLYECGRLPLSVDPDVYDGLDRLGGGISLVSCYIDNGLKELAPILINYDFFQ